jgi:hypothetical protein
MGFNINLRCKNPEPRLSLKGQRQTKFDVRVRSLSASRADVLGGYQQDRSSAYPMAIRVFRSRREAVSMRRVTIANIAQPP